MKRFLSISAIVTLAAVAGVIVLAAAVVLAAGNTMGAFRRDEDGLQRLARPIPNIPDRPDDEYVALARWWSDDTMWRGIARPNIGSYRAFEDWCVAREIELTVRLGLRTGTGVDELRKFDVTDCLAPLEVLL